MTTKEILAIGIWKQKKELILHHNYFPDQNNSQENDRMIVGQFFNEFSEIPMTKLLIVDQSLNLRMGNL